MKLSRVKQCQTCPWKLNADPYNIPNGYSVSLHENLACTIANPGELRMDCKMNVMACHYSEVGQETPCIGWLHNQLGVGNNIGLRIQMMSCENAKEIEVYGEQHQRFEDTLPEY